MIAGRLDRAIRIERAERTLDGNREPLEEWEPLFAWTLPAQLVANDIVETMRDPGASVDDELTFRIRWISDLRPDDRVIFEGRPHDIVNIREEGRRRVLAIRCKTRRL